MIRINLLTVERERTTRRVSFQFAQKVTLLCSLVLVVTGLSIGWWYWTLAARSARLDADLRATQGEADRLRQLIGQVQQFEQRRTQLEQRVRLIEQLRQGQAAPVHMLDQISRSLPDGLWLTEIRQQDMDLSITGRCLALTALTDFALNLETSGFFRRPVDILESQVERSGQNEAEVIRFVVKAQFAPPASPGPAT